MRSAQHNPSAYVAPDAASPQRNQRSKPDDEVDQSPLPARKTRLPDPTASKDSAASLSKNPPPTTKRDLPDVDNMPSPTSAPKVKRLRTKPSLPDSLEHDEIDTAAENDQDDAALCQVQLSIATGLPPADVTVKKLYDVSDVSTMRKCNAVAAQHFLPEIFAAGFKSDLKVLAYRLQKTDFIQGSNASNDDEEWIAVPSGSLNIFKRWIDSVKTGAGENKCPCIQILVLDEESAKAYDARQPLLTRTQQQKPVPCEVIPVPQEDEQSAVAKMLEAKEALAAWKGKGTAKGTEASAAKGSKASASSNAPQDNASIKKLEKAQAENKDLKAEIKQLRKDTAFEIRNLAVELDHIQLQRDDRANEKAELAEELEQVNKDLTKAERQNGKLDRENAKLKKQVAALTKKLEQGSLDD